MIALQSGASKDVVEFLLVKGADVNAKIQVSPLAAISSVTC
jgi:hypothetical protein